MPEPETLERAHRDEEEGKSPSTQAGEFVREEMHHVREGKHGARSPEQAIAIGLSKARRAGVKLRPPKSAATSAVTRRKAARDSARGRSGRGRPKSSKRSRAVRKALKREGRAHAGPVAALTRRVSRSRRLGLLRRVAAFSDSRPRGQPLAQDVERRQQQVDARLGQRLALFSRRALMAALVFEAHLWNVRLALEVLAGNGPLEGAGCPDRCLPPIGLRPSDDRPCLPPRTAFDCGMDLSPPMRPLQKERALLSATISPAPRASLLQRSARRGAR